ncbi:uncharacterized protein SCHCODRAFT_02238072 [Schizophyllum commune H4-8]|uniref:uncharacterized protein n=1 Tax=Schizophyllum commune (strain H4-8 / FGSC 9210) TaxID=578458 RepID=UPI00215FAABD|nr:uncharacterized protein SCHCODRAFT_02238072 [Schizophyllum commune H4-8]KAI5895694.1 hypothetical protein SCHCODRAFT_02238072 [Schizophyllum commune H4-8]
MDHGVRRGRILLADPIVWGGTLIIAILSESASAPGGAAPPIAAQRDLARGWANIRAPTRIVPLNCVGPRAGG